MARNDGVDGLAEVQRLAVLEDFVCAAERCEDTCCRGWSMVVDDPTASLYRHEAPELEEALDHTAVGTVMRRDCTSDTCVKLTAGLCGIQKQYGTAFVNDSCHFYPRITRRLGAELHMSAFLSCPSIARLALFGERPFVHSGHRVERLPNKVRDILPEGLTPKEGASVIEGFLALAGDPTSSPERAMVRIACVAQSLQHQPPARWAEATPFLIDSVEDRLATAEADAADPHRLLLALAVLAHAAQHPSGERFQETFRTMEKALAVRLEPSSFALMRLPGPVGPDDAYPRLRELWQDAAPRMAPVLHRWLQAEIDSSAFPHAGLGSNPAERATILGIRFATVRLALMSHVADDGTPPDPDTIVRVVQSLARLLDHLAEPELSLSIYREAGWHREARLRGLLDDAPGWAGDALGPRRQFLPPSPAVPVSTISTA